MAASESLFDSIFGKDKSMFDAMFSSKSPPIRTQINIGMSEEHIKALRKGNVLRFKAGPQTILISLEE